MWAAVGLIVAFNLDPLDAGFVNDVLYIVTILPNDFSCKHYTHTLSTWWPLSSQHQIHRLFPDLLFSQEWRRLF